MHTKPVQGSLLEVVTTHLRYGKDRYGCAAARAAAEHGVPVEITGRPEETTCPHCIRTAVREGRKGTEPALRAFAKRHGGRMPDRRRRKARPGAGAERAAAQPTLLPPPGGPGR